MLLNPLSPDHITDLTNLTKIIEHNKKTFEDMVNLLDVSKMHFLVKERFSKSVVDCIRDLSSQLNGLLMQERNYILSTAEEYIKRFEQMQKMDTKISEMDDLIKDINSYSSTQEFKDQIMAIHFFVGHILDFSELLNHAFGVVTGEELTPFDVLYADLPDALERIRKDKPKICTYDTIEIVNYVFSPKDKEYTTLHILGFSIMTDLISEIRSYQDAIEKEIHLLLIMERIEDMK